MATLRAVAARTVRPAVSGPVALASRRLAVSARQRAPDEKYDVPRPIPLGDREEQRDFEEALVRPDGDQEAKTSSEPDGLTGPVLFS